MCTYELRKRTPRISTNARSVSHDNASTPQAVRALPPKPPVIGFSFSEPPTHPSSDVPLLTWSDPSESTSSLPPSPHLTPYERSLTPSPHVHGEIVSGPSSGVSVVRNVRATMEHVPRPTVSYITVLPSIHFQTIPRPLQLRVPLSLIPPEHVQISAIAGGDLDMT